MELAGLAERTQKHYLDAVRDYAKYFGRSPSQLGHEDLRTWSRHLLDSGVGDGRLRQHFSALKFLYKKTLAQPDAVAFLSFRGKTGPLLDILSAEEVERTLGAVRRPRFRMLFTTMYATGLRLKEARYLETGDLNGKRGVIVVRHAKGGKERLVPLSQTLLGQLREYWKAERPSAPYLFPSSVCAAPMSADVARRALKLAAREAGICDRRDRVLARRRGWGELKERVVERCVEERYYLGRVFRVKSTHGGFLNVVEDLGRKRLA
jgi:integrase